MSAATTTYAVALVVFVSGDLGGFQEAVNGVRGFPLDKLHSYVVWKPEDSPTPMGGPKFSTGKADTIPEAVFIQVHSLLILAEPVTQHSSKRR